MEDEPLSDLVSIFFYDIKHNERCMAFVRKPDVSREDWEEAVMRIVRYLAQNEYPAIYPMGGKKWPQQRSA